MLQLESVELLAAAGSEDTLEFFIVKEDFELTIEHSRA